MNTLDRNQEYLLWFEWHRDRWIALPIDRHGPLIATGEYVDAVPLYFVDDSSDSTSDGAHDGEEGPDMRS